MATGLMSSPEADPVKEAPGFDRLHHETIAKDRVSRSKTFAMVSYGTWRALTRVRNIPPRGGRLLHRVAANFADQRAISGKDDEILSGDHDLIQCWKAAGTICEAGSRVRRRQEIFVKRRPCLKKRTSIDVADIHISDWRDTGRLGLAGQHKPPLSRRWPGCVA